MNESSWGAPPQAGYWGPSDQGPAQGAAPAGPTYDAHDAQQTRPMPIVPDVPAHGGDQDDDRGAARLSGPLFRDDTPQTTSYGSQTPYVTQSPYGSQTPHGAQPQKPEPMPDAPQPAPAPQKKSAGRDLGAAIGVGVGLGVVIVASLFVVKAVFVGVIAVAVVVGLWELTSRLEERKGIKAPLVPLAVGGAAMVVAGYVRGAEGAWVAMALTALAVLVWRMTEPPEGYLRDVTAGVFAAFYVPFLATFVAMMLTADDGPRRVLTFLLLTVVSDTGAYAIGWRFGKHRLAPRISPGKTREGLVGAVSFAMVAGALCMEFLIDDGSWWQGLVLGFAVAASATLGDLGESMIKRDLGIKDMGTLLPGHGGIMDRLDSLLPTAPVVWLLLVIFVGSG
ncbi:MULTISPECIES: phosphatidate cytidylyltransferase [Streptomyces]|uniref:Phosphatidate cytidylyltransferase n=3 Tax=Streptomyces avermitilis TaxID=33903 RepID=Q82JY1_STRAW|nr:MULTISPECIES: phosphatidate cytidylyltransferase [Streptomyces]MYS98224.1 phosphatidate cytidylyltransferase [Streptomyces sp. SID5469]OOV33364.1 phosphatidate cytidylyltransferase [Streptomyces avermitilis]BAC70334.1 putative phosphatidate cytidylyltransferase [Streptomyces avermitilis MA-4680 = NBRC 14893]BBJ50428.1 phosphatidate cytidylyltransferase [Streptomyces avermitilis]GDY77437.1 phosphatidate cytidylyltransferase [Streptomyces avermitilis]